MKTKIYRLSRRSISMLLAVLLMFSVLGVGSLITAYASNNRGWSYNSSGWYVQSTFSGWSDTVALPSKDTTYNTSKTYTFYLEKADAAFYFKLHDSNNSKWVNPDTSVNITSAGSNNTDASSHYDSYAITRSDLDEGYYYKTIVDFYLEGNNGYGWIEIRNNARTKLSKISPTLNVPSEGEVGTAITLTGDSTDANKVGTLTKTYQYSTDNGVSWNDLGSGSYTAASAGTVKFRYKVQDGGVVASTNSATNRIEYSDVKSCVFSNPPSCTPVIKNSAGTAELADTSIYAHQLLKFKTVDPESHDATYTVSKDSGADSASTYLSSYSSVADDTVVTFNPNGNTGTYVITSTCSGGGSDSVTVTVNAEPTVEFKTKTGSRFAANGLGEANKYYPTYDATASAALSGGKESHVVFSLKDQSFAAANTSYYWCIWNGTNNVTYNTAITSTAGTGAFGDDNGVATVNINGSNGQTIKTLSATKDHYNIYYDLITGKFYIEYPVTVTTKRSIGPDYGTTTPEAITSGTSYIAYNTAFSQPADASKTGYIFSGWYDDQPCETSTNFTAKLTEDKTIYAKMEAKTSALTFDYTTNGGSGTTPTSITAVYGVAMPSISTALPDTRTGYTFDGVFDASSSGTKYYNADGSSARNWDKNKTDGTTLYAQWTAKTSNLTFNMNTPSGQPGSGSLASGLTATYDSAMPTYTEDAPSRTGYRFEGFYDAAEGGTQYYTSALASARNWDKDTTEGTTLYAHWTEYSGTMALTSVGSGHITNASDVTVTSDTVGIDTHVTAKAVVDDGDYIFDGWTKEGDFAAHILLFTDSGCTTPYEAGDRTHTTIYIKTDGTDSPAASTAIVKANFINGARTYVVGQMVKDDTGNYTIAKASAASNTGDGFNATTTIGNSGNVTVYETASLNTTGDISATDTQNPTVTVNGSDNFSYTKYKFVGWKKSDTPLTEVSGSNSTWDGATASYSPTVPTTGEGYWYACYQKYYVFCAFRSYNYAAGTSGQIIFIASPPTKYQIGSAAATGYTNQGEKFAVPAGEDLKLTYTSLASSDCIDRVYYDDTDYTTATPTAENFNSSNQHEITSGISVDQSAHEVTIQMTQNYKNIHIKLGTKYKVFFSDYKNAAVHSKNVDDYYAPGEAMSGDAATKKLSVAAVKSATQTNKIDSDNIKIYYATPTGEYATDASGTTVSEDPVEVTGAFATITKPTGTSTGTASDNGTALEFTGTMPDCNVYIDLGLETTYEFHLGTRMVSDTTNSYVTWAKIAETKAIYKTHEWQDTDWDTATQSKVTWNSGAIDAVDKGDSVKLTWTFFDDSNESKYMFLGWYKGNADGPDYSEKNCLSTNKTYTYTPKSNVYIYAVGTRDMYINGTATITGTESWPETNLKMSFDPDYVNPEDATKRGRYYWEITEEMLAASSDSGKLRADSGVAYDHSNGTWIHGGLDSQKDAGWNRAAANSWFRIYDGATNSGYGSTDNLTYWTSINDQENNKTDSDSNDVLKWGKAKDGDSVGNDQKTKGLGFIVYNASDYPAYSAPIRIYAYPGHGIDVDATPVYSNLYVSNGYSVGSTLRTDAVTVQPVYDNNVVTNGQTGYFVIQDKETFSPSKEGAVHKFIPKQKNATVRITKPCRGADKVSAFLVYDLDNDKVYSLKDIKNSGTNYYIDLTVKLKQNLYIIPIIEAENSDVTVNFDATQLNKTQWGDLVCCYAWYGSGGGDALGAFPGQPMVVSDDMGSWTAKFPSTITKNSTEYTIAGITFSNGVDGTQSWLGTTGGGGTKVMSTVTYSNTSVPDGVGSIASVADDGLIKQYNKIVSGKEDEYSRQNFKAQTYDYREPIAIYNNADHTESVETTITFAMKDGNTSLLSWRHAELLNSNIIDNEWGGLTWEYLTNSTGNKYSDLNGRAMEDKPTATYYIAAKGGYVYHNGNATAAFYSGKSYDTADHSYVNFDHYKTSGTNWYEQDAQPVNEFNDNGTVKSRKSYTNYGWTHDSCPSTVTYGDATNTTADPNEIDFDYAVQWYVYDAAGNYITTVLSSAFADMNSAKTQSYIARELENKGYAVDGKAVAMCYDKPRYYYWDSDSVTYGASKGSGSGKVNSGEGFAGYRFTGQWYSTVKTEPVTVDVRVGMMTSDGEIVSKSNVAGYGNASVVYSTVNNTASYPSEIHSDGTKSLTIALADGEKSIVKLDASSTNFVGWYYYDGNTGEFTKASYDKNSDFFPHVAKDVTYYAMYSASATYEYQYTGREGAKAYSVAGGELSEGEMEDGSILNLSNRLSAIKSGTYAPIGKISVFKRTLDFAKKADGTDVDGSNFSNKRAPSDSSNVPYFLFGSGFKNVADTVTLTAHYKDASGNNQTTAVSEVYNGQAVELKDGTGKGYGHLWTGHKFLGWYAYDGSTIGELLSTQAIYGMRLTGNQDIIAVYESDGSGKTLPTASDTWHAYIDENVVTKEMYSADDGMYYNDTIVRVRNDNGVTVALPEGAEVGVLMINDYGKNLTTTGYEDSLTTYANGLASGKTGKIGSEGLRVTKVSTTSVTNFNRTDIAIRGKYSNLKGSKYTVYAYIKLANGTYVFSSGKTVTGAYTV